MTGNDRQPVELLWRRHAFPLRIPGLRTGVAEFAGERTARQATQEQLAVARAAADRATAELVELARRLAAIVEAEIVPKWQSRLGRAWGWFLRN